MGKKTHSPKIPALILRSGISQTGYMLIGVFVIVVIVIIGFVVEGSKSENFRSSIANMNLVEGLDRQWHTHVDKLYYINLDSREDRKTDFLEEMRKMGVPDEKVVRISAVSKPGQGDLGCSLSHIIALEQFIDSGLDNCIVFEDDFTFTQSLQTVNANFESVFSADVVYDVIMLSANEVETKKTEHKFLKKVENAQTTSGYMLTKYFATILLQNYRDGAKLLADSYKAGKSDALQGPFCIDQYWKRLQPQSNWFVFSPKLGVQRESHSDIQGGTVNPGV